jgi:ribonuclease HII
MIRPTLKLERKLWRQGKIGVIGLDEVGVGALAGPVFVAGVCFSPGYQPPRALVRFLRDSKTLNARQRQVLFKEITSDQEIKWVVGRVSPAVVDQINIRESVVLAMKRCLKRFPRVDYVLIDGAVALKRYSVPQKAIVKGDGTIFSIAAASIIAKVSRDAYMQKLDKVLPEYEFANHKGYGTKQHFKKIKRLGLSLDHRLSFCDHITVAK